MIESYRLAETTIQIASDNPRLHKMCEAYRSSETPDFFVQANPEDIVFEREKSQRDAQAEGRSPHRTSNAQLESLAIYRKIAERMPAFDTVLFHGSAVAVDGVAYVFTAKSGTGKSTHTRLWCELLGERAVMVNDDKPLIRIGADGATIYGTPWSGKHHLSSNVSAPLKSICILKRASKNCIASVSATDALLDILRQCYRPADPEALLKTFSLVDRLMRNVELYRLECSIDIEAARMAYEAMR
ncbi:MAG: hypothetical protein IJ125_08635 [Atopobiaceae bacterium]|nr:hypothetical protein [Atopobiaceae bacterium]